MSCGTTDWERKGKESRGNGDAENRREIEGGGECSPKYAICLRVSSFKQRKQLRPNFKKYLEGTLGLTEFIAPLFNLASVM